jgi:tetratricopeptide (TPR) repeat protein
MALNKATRIDQGVEVIMYLRAFATISLILVCAGCASPVGYTRPTSGDQLPMYGGMNREAEPSLKEADRQLIEGAIKEFGSRESASAGFANIGFGYYYRNEFDEAMRRFNQAWLLNPRSPDVYWGFASVLHDQQKYCEAKEMIDKALALNPPENRGFYPDAGRMYTLCAISNATLSEKDKERLIEESERLYRKAEEIEPDKAYLYLSWATAYYWRGQYEDAWKMVEKHREAGGKTLPDDHFVSMLRAKMPEPVQKK